MAPIKDKDPLPLATVLASLLCRYCQVLHSPRCARAVIVNLSGISNGSRHSESLEIGEASMVGQTCDNDATVAGKRRRDDGWWLNSMATQSPATLPGG